LNPDCFQEFLLLIARRLESRDLWNQFVERSVFRVPRTQPSKRTLSALFNVSASPPSTEVQIVVVLFSSILFRKPIGKAGTSFSRKILLSLTRESLVAGANAILDLEKQI
jgi:hypothetical protein